MQAAEAHWQPPWEGISVCYYAVFILISKVVNRLTSSHGDFFVIRNIIVSLRSMTVTDVGRIRGHIAERTRMQSLGHKWLLMVIPLKNTIQIKPYGKPAAIAALKNRKRRLWRNLIMPTNSKRTVLFGVEWGYTLEERKSLNSNDNMQSLFWYLNHTIFWINSSYLPTHRQLLCRDAVFTVTQKLNLQTHYLLHGICPSKNWNAGFPLKEVLVNCH